MSSILKYNDQILKHNDQILSVSSSTPTPCPSCGWTYPSDWPSIYEEGEGKLVFLFKDVSTLFGFYAVTANSGDYTINWGDGAGDETIGSSSLVTHSYVPGDGSICSEGYTTYKAVITPPVGDTFTYFRFYSNGVNHYETIVPVLAAYSEVDLINFTDFSYMFSQQRSQTTSGGVYCPYLKSVKFKDSTNSVTNLSYMLYMSGSDELVELVLPTIDWTQVSNIDYMLYAPNLTFQIPTTFGVVTNMSGPFYCISDVSELSFTGVANATSFSITGISDVRKITVDDLTAATTVNPAVPDVEELILPSDLPACTNFNVNNSKITDLTIPSVAATAIIGIQSNRFLKNITFTPCVIGGLNLIQNTALETANIDALTTSAAKTFRLTNNDTLLDVSINALCSQLILGVQSGDTYANNATRSILVNSTAGQFAQHCYVRYCNLDDTALNALFSSLPTVTSKTIYIKGNPGIGVGGYDATIATSKGWTVNTTT